jgi:hypothetical protein
MVQFVKLNRITDKFQSYYICFVYTGNNHLMSCQGSVKGKKGKAIPVTGCEGP